MNYTFTPGTYTTDNYSRAKALVMKEVNRFNEPIWRMYGERDIAPDFVNYIVRIAVYLTAGASEDLIPYLTANNITVEEYKANRDTIHLLAALT